MGWNDLSIPKLQRCNRWSLGIYVTLSWECNYLFMLGLKLIFVSKWVRSVARLFDLTPVYAKPSADTVINKSRPRIYSEPLYTFQGFGNKSLDVNCNVCYVARYRNIHYDLITLFQHMGRNMNTLILPHYWQTTMCCWSYFSYQLCRDKWCKPFSN